MDVLKWLEFIGMLISFAYLILLIRENIWCWFFGILGSAITVVLFFYTKLYLESLLNIYYVAAGFYGYYFWKNKSGKVPDVIEWKWTNHLIGLIFVVGSYMILWPLMAQYTDSPRPHMDTLLAVASFLATFMEARKVLSTWVYWFIINGASIWLQMDRGLHFYAIVSLVYTIMCIPGYFSWKKSYQLRTNV